MTDEKVIQVIVPEALKEPLIFDLWRPRVDENKNLILDFAKKETEDEYTLVSSITVENRQIDKFINEFLYKIFVINQEHNLDISLFMKIDSNKKTVEENE